MRYSKEYFVNQLLCSVIIRPGYESLFERYNMLKEEIYENVEETITILDEAFQQVLEEWFFS